MDWLRYDKVLGRTVLPSHGLRCISTGIFSVFSFSVGHCAGEGFSVEKARGAALWEHQRSRSREQDCESIAEIVDAEIVSCNDGTADIWAGRVPFGHLGLLVLFVRTLANAPVRLSLLSDAECTALYFCVREVRVRTVQYRTPY